MRTTSVLTSLLLSALVACGDDASPANDSSSDDGADDSTGNGNTLGTTVSASTTVTTDPGSSSDAGESSSSSDTGSSSDDGSSSASGSSSESGSESVAVSISFAADVAGEPFACGQSYPGVGSTAVEIVPVDLRFFVQDLRLVGADDVEVAVQLDIVPPWQSETVALVDFEDATGACEAGGGNPAINTVVTGTVPPGDYVGVAFTVGVPEDLNHADPLFNPAPLGATSMTWGWLFGYKFLKLEVQQVVDEGVLAGVGVFHLGSTGCEGNPGVGDVECSLPNRAEIRLDDFDAAVDTIALDVAAMFADVDLTTDSSCHSFQETCAPLFERSGVDFTTGLPTASQVVFSVR